MDDSVREDVRLRLRDARSLIEDAQRTLADHSQSIDDLNAAVVWVTRVIERLEVPR